MKVGVHLVGQKDVEKALDSLMERGTKIKKEVLITGHAVRNKARANLNAFNAVDTGHLKRSILVEQEDALGGIMVEVGPTAPFGHFVEYGTGIFGPYKTPLTKMPPVAALEEWARHHGIDPFVLARAILRKGGLKPRPYLYPAAEEEIPPLYDRIKRLF